MSGKILGNLTKHSGIFQIAEHNISAKCNSNINKIKIEYDYNDKNLKNFVDDLYEQLKTECFKKPDCFDKFCDIFKSALDNTCKLEKPTFTKRKYLNNPWTTTGIIRSITTNEQLYNSWRQSFEHILMETPSLKKSTKSIKINFDGSLKKQNQNILLVNLKNLRGARKEEKHMAFN